LPSSPTPPFPVRDSTSTKPQLASPLARSRIAAFGSAESAARVSVPAPALGGDSPRSPVPVNANGDREGSRSPSKSVRAARGSATSAASSAAASNGDGHARVSYVGSSSSTSTYVGPSGLAHASAPERVRRAMSTSAAETLREEGAEALLATVAVPLVGEPYSPSPTLRQVLSYKLHTQAIPAKQ
jgi:hypothetical protein